MKQLKVKRRNSVNADAFCILIHEGFEPELARRIAFNHRNSTGRGTHEISMFGEPFIIFFYSPAWNDDEYLIVNYEYEPR